MMKSIATRIPAMVAILLFSCLLGCQVINDSAAMRIEVEVYKGPLSLEPEIQLGELYGYLSEAQSGLSNASEFIERVKKQLVPKLDAIGNPLNTVSEGCRPEDTTSLTDNTSCALLIPLAEDARDLASRLLLPLCALRGEPDLEKCKLLETPPSTAKDKTSTAEYKTSTGSPVDAGTVTQIRQDTAKEMRKQLGRERFSYSPKSSSSGTSSHEVNYREALLETGRIAATMQAKAFRYATATTAGHSYSFLVRIATTYFIVATSEYGNQIQARADALLKQLGPEGRDRRELPLSAHLREAEPTDFVHLFDWTDGHLPRFYDYVHANFSPNLEQRIKIIDRLYADHFWSKINTVYASGRGKAQMAFIKDETGNWNLKSFDNDPTELLDAYTKVTKSAIEGVVEVAAKIASGGAEAGLKKAADELLAIAHETDPDKALQATPAAGTLSLNHLRARIDGQLNATQVQSDLKEDKKLMDRFKTAKEASDEAKASLEKAKQDSTGDIKILSDEEKTTATALQNAQKDLVAHRKTVIGKWAALIDDHSQLVDLLSSTVNKK